MWEQLHSAGGSLAVVGVLVIIFVGAAIYAVRHSGSPPDGAKYPWLRLDEVLAIIRNPEWTWARNNRCKYLSIRLDTRTRTNLCVIYDRHGQALTLDELKFQERRRHL